MSVRFWKCQFPNVVDLSECGSYLSKVIDVSECVSYLRLCICKPASGVYGCLLHWGVQCRMLFNCTLRHVTGTLTLCLCVAAFSRRTLPSSDSARPSSHLYLHPARMPCHWCHHHRWRRAHRASRRRYDAHSSQRSASRRMTRTWRWSRRAPAHWGSVSTVTLTRSLTRGATAAQTYGGRRHGRQGHLGGATACRCAPCTTCAVHRSC